MSAKLNIMCHNRYTSGQMLCKSGALAGPAIISNVTVPLLGLSDTYISGHLGAELYIAAIAVGTMMVNALYWLCGFLRMGTTGLAAEAFGRKDDELRRKILNASLWIGVGIGVFMILLSPLLQKLMLTIMDPPAETGILAGDYFRITVMGAPAYLAGIALLGWMLGSQNTLYPMIVSISINVLNIIISFSLVFGFNLGFEGVAFGTMAANWLGLPIALLLARRLIRGRLLMNPSGGWWKEMELFRFFKVNGNLFVRSACLMAVSFALTGFAGKFGDNTLAVNAILMQFFMFFSYFMDGFAFSGEALCGRFAGAGERRNFTQAVKALFIWAGIVTLVFTVIYILFTPQISSLLTDVNEVRKSMVESQYIAWILPAVSVAAFMFDGIYIGLTNMSRMMWATMAGALVFFLSYFVLLPLYECHIWMVSPSILLWTSFLAYLFIRGFVLGIGLPKAVSHRFS